MPCPLGRGIFPVWRMSMKKNKKAKKNSIVMYVLFAALLLAAVLLVVTRFINSTDTQEPVNSAAVPPVSTPAPENTTSIDLDSGLEITSIGRYAGSFVEDGSDDIVSDVCAITVRNNGEATVQYAEIVMDVGGENYEFKLSTLPAGRSVQLLELSRRTAPESTDDVTAELKNIVTFAPEPSLCADVIQIDVQDTAITVTNISDSDINGQIYVYYKSAYGDLYLGGITYRTGISSLAAGQSTTLYASHYSTEYSEIMFVTYVQ